MRCLLACFALVPMCHGLALARQTQDLQALRDSAAAFVAERVAAAHPDARAEIGIGPIDPRLTLPACPRPIFNLTPGSQLWGNGSLAVNCAEPSAWSLYLTYRSRLAGPALLASRPLPAGGTPGPDDVVPGETDYAGNPGRYPREISALRGATLTRTLAKGQPITVDILHVRPIIKAGQRVRMIVDGDGFQVSQEGIAQSQASIGDALRLKMPSGRLVQGVVQADGTVRSGR